MKPAFSQKTPVLLLHGIDDTRSAFVHMKQALAERGQPVLEHDFIPNNGTVALETLASVLKTTIKQEVGEQPIQIVAFSLGGIIAQYYLQELDGIAQTTHFISIAAPHAGTYTAYFRLGRGVAQLRPGHPFLTRLNQKKEILLRSYLWTIGTPYDLTIIPHTSTVLFPERHTIIRSMAHPLLLRNRQCIQTVLKHLETPGRSHH